MPIKEFFEDWQSIKTGEWSKYAFTLYSGEKCIDVMLFREPFENEEYAGTYTLQVFIGGDVVYCHQVEMGE